MQEKCLWARMRAAWTNEGRMGRGWCVKKTAKDLQNMRREGVGRMGEFMKLTVWSSIIAKISR